ncbi:hypothetical protein [Nocardioides sp.]|uniref:hypothetical protein n=1 Tax=Nocardioides sp. TaxID=35761 RepID=UPI002612E45C|nr:hypothetical protein [Nocardioides sp.]MDI6910409.1 hypothetical protein [Nocardioides sp.]
MFEIHNEGDFATAKVFLTGWLPKAHAHLSELLGLPDPPDVVHVFLSDRATHEQRFPVRVEEKFLDAGGEQPAHDIPARGEFYAHGVAHLTETSLVLPAGVPDGAPGIFLDCETVRQIADELGLEFEPVLGSTAIHELSHVVRGHPTSDGARTHGFAREGDAQRDAWAVKASMLASSSTRATALAGRAAQVRLANHQPRAYTMFGQDSVDRYHWNHEEPKVDVHLIRTPRNLLAVVKEDVVVLPVRTVLPPVPEVGDLVYLAQERDDKDYFVVGPWVVLNRDQETAVLAEKDRKEVQWAEERDRGPRRTFEYLVLRPSTLRAARAISPDDLPAIGLPYCAAESGDWLAHLGDTVDAIFEERRQELTDEFEEFWRDMSEDLGRDVRPADWSFGPDAE